MKKRTPLETVVWAGLFGLMWGVVSAAACTSTACGGRLRAEECTDARFPAFCARDVICCPSGTLCGDEANDAGDTCPRGYCCHAPPDAGAAAPELRDWWDEAVVGVPASFTPGS